METEFSELPLLLVGCISELGRNFAFVLVLLLHFLDSGPVISLDLCHHTGIFDVFLTDSGRVLVVGVSELVVLVFEPFHASVEQVYSLVLAL